MEQVDITKITDINQLKAMLSDNRDVLDQLTASINAIRGRIAELIQQQADAAAATVDKPAEPNRAARRSHSKKK